MQSTGGCALAGCKPELTVPGTGPVQRILGAATFAMAAEEEFLRGTALRGAASTTVISEESDFVLRAIRGTPVLLKREPPDRASSSAGRGPKGHERARQTVGRVEWFKSLRARQLWWKVRQDLIFLPLSIGERVQGG